MDKVKNIIVVCDFGFIDGGAARIAIETAILLKKANKKVTYFCAVGPVTDRLKDANVEVVCLNQSDILHEKSKLKAVCRGIYNRVSAKRFRALLRGFSPENTVVHVHTWTKAISSSIFPIAQKQGFKVFLTVHDYFLVCPNGGLLDYPHKKMCNKKPMSVSCLFCNCDSRSYPQKVFRIIRQIVQNINIRFCKNIAYIFISEYSKKLIFGRYTGSAMKKQLFLNNTVDFPLKRTRIECEKNADFLFIGTVSELKGIRQFCEAVTAAKVPATVIGKGDLLEELQSQYKNIEFVGWKNKEEMLPYMEKSRCLIFPSICCEVSPLTTLEVMAYGLPIICSDKNAGCEQITPNVTGFLYDGQNTNKLVEVIKLCENDEIIKHASESTYESFDADKYSGEQYLKNLLDLYNE